MLREELAWDRTSSALAASGCVYVCGDNAAPIMIMTGVSASVPISALPGVP
jgi:hypothetical protein